MSWWRGVRVAVKPTALPLSHSELSLRTRVDSHQDDSALLESYQRSAVASIDGPDGIGYAMLTQTWERVMDWFPATIVLPGFPIQSVESITYRDASDAEQTVDPSDYELINDYEPAVIEPVAGWPVVGRRRGTVVVRYVLGHATPSDVPDDLRDAVALMVAHRYENRQPVVMGSSVTELPMGVGPIIEKYRRTRVAA